MEFDFPQVTSRLLPAGTAGWGTSQACNKASPVQTYPSAASWIQPHCLCPSNCRWHCSCCNKHMTPCPIMRDRVFRSHQDMSCACFKLSLCCQVMKNHKEMDWGSQPLRSLFWSFSSENSSSSLQWRLPMPPRPVSSFICSYHWGFTLQWTLWSQLQWHRCIIMLTPPYSFSFYAFSENNCCL